MTKLKDLNSEWFFSKPPHLLRSLSIYVKGDALVILPFWIVILLVAIFNFRFALVAGLIFLSIRSLGEMLYWFLHQFGMRSYRPDDFYLPNLDNHSIYIIYQLTSLIWSVIYISLLIFVFKYYL